VRQADLMLARAGRHDGFCPDLLGDLDGGQAHTACPGVNQGGLAREQAPDFQ